MRTIRDRVLGLMGGRAHEREAEAIQGGCMNEKQAAGCVQSALTLLILIPLWLVMMFGVLGIFRGILENAT